MGSAGRSSADCPSVSNPARPNLAGGSQNARRAESLHPARLSALRACRSSLHRHIRTIAAARAAIPDRIGWLAPNRFSLTRGAAEVPRLASHGLDLVCHPCAIATAIGGVISCRGCCRWYRFRLSRSSERYVVGLKSRWCASHRSRLGCRDSCRANETLEFERRIFSYAIGAQRDWRHLA